ncbi:MAG: PAS domain-containing sensor histidine kinase, partial [Desulfobulbaceae bacterium]|nr:PAS domain-containing sensor histidine kinase [Desulfobulbaceae bacterium]
LYELLGRAVDFDVIFVELALLQSGGEVSEGILKAVEKNGGNFRLIALTNDLPAKHSLAELPVPGSFLRKPVDFDCLKTVLHSLGIMLRKLNCWEYKQCGRETGGENSLSLGVCPATKITENNQVHGGQYGGRSCWVVSGTLCDGYIQGSFASKIKSCLDCDFYRLVAVEESDRFESIDKSLLKRQHELTRSSVSEGIFGVDNAGMITSFNFAAEKITGFSTEDVLGKHHLIFCRDKNKSAVDSKESPLLSCMTQGDSYRSDDHYFMRSDGSDFPVQLTCAPIVEDDKITGGVVLFKDVTEELRIRRKKERAEQKLSDLADTLEERVRQRTAELQGANKELVETLDQLREAQSQLVQSEKMASLGGLVAGVAHEINTPIGIAYTASTHLEKETDKVVGFYHNGKMKRRDFEEYLSTCTEATKLLYSNLNRAGQLIRSFKQVAIDQSVEDKRHFNFREYLDEVLLSLRPMLKKTYHSVEINCDDEIMLYSYAGVFSQVLTNLITNSVIHAFMPDDAGIISITFSQDGNEWLFRYNDNGKGIAAGDLSRIFDPFFTTNRENGGSGLGMHVVFNLITQKLKGTISCESELGHGTAFTIRIPCESVENGAGENANGAER